MNKNLDLYIVYQFLKKLSTPFKDWKAFDLGIIDDKGNVLKSRDQLTDKELKDWTYFDLLVTNIKKLISAIPAGNQKMANMVMALYLTKEYKGKKIMGVIVHTTNSPHFKNIANRQVPYKSPLCAHPTQDGAYKKKFSYCPEEMFVSDFPAGDVIVVISN